MMGIPKSTATFNSTQAPVVFRRLPSPDLDQGVYLLNIPIQTKSHSTLANPAKSVPPRSRPLTRSLDAEDVDSKTWRRIELLAWKADEETCDIVLLRPTWWIEHTGARVGSLIRLAMPEMGVDGPAKVLSIGPCPPISPGMPGTQVVTGTFRHKAKSILHLHLAGLEKPIGVTPNHPMFSLDKHDFIAAGKLRIGEHLKTRTGVIAVVERIEVISGEQPVYNLEVHKDHVFFVSKLGVMVHNSCEFFENPLDALGPGGEDAILVPNSEVQVSNPRLIRDGFTKRRIYKMPWGEFKHVFYRPGEGWGFAGPSSHME